MNNNTFSKEMEGGQLAHLLEDFRRALLMHRKIRLGILFRMYFPNAGRPFLENNKDASGMDFRKWLAKPLPEEIRSSRLFRRLIAEQGGLIQTADACKDEVRQGALQPDTFTELLRAIQRFDLAADRFVSGITTTMTDVDALTGLLNRSAMERDLEVEEAQARRCTVQRRQGATGLK